MGGKKKYINIYSVFSRSPSIHNQSICLFFCTLITMHIQILS